MVRGKISKPFYSYSIDIVANALFWRDTYIHRLWVDGYDCYAVLTSTRPHYTGVDDGIIL